MAARVGCMRPFENEAEIVGGMGVEKWQSGKVAKWREKSQIGGICVFGSETRGAQRKIL